MKAAIAAIGLMLMFIFSAGSAKPLKAQTTTVHCTVDGNYVHCTDSATLATTTSYCTTLGDSVSCRITSTTAPVDAQAMAANSQAIGEAIGKVIRLAAQHHRAKSEPDELVKGNVTLCLKSPATAWCSDYMGHVGGKDNEKYLKALAKTQTH